MRGPASQHAVVRQLAPPGGELAGLLRSACRCALVLAPGVGWGTIRPFAPPEPPRDAHGQPTSRPPDAPTRYLRGQPHPAAVGGHPARRAEPSVAAGGAGAG